MPSNVESIGATPTLAGMRVKERSDFGERLTRARTHAKLSQPELAERVGMAQSTIAALEMRGQGSSRVASLAQACGVRALWLETGEGPMLGPDAAQAASVHQAQEALAPYLVSAPTAARDYRTVVHTLADALERSGVALSISQFLALADATFEKFGKH